MDIFSQLLYSALNAIDPSLYVTSTDRTRMNNSVLVVVNVCEAPLSTDDYLALRDMMLGIRREIVFLREADDDVEDGAYERMLEEWRLVL